MTDNIDDQYDESMELFGGRIPKIGEPVEYIITDKDMAPRLSEECAKALIEKYGHTELHSTVEDDIPDEELDDFDYYGRHGFSRDAPICTDPDCPCDE